MHYLSNAEYVTAYSLVPRLCVDLILISDGNILLVERTCKPFVGWWHLPGGRVRLRESVDEAANRIVQKETGIILAGIKKRMIGYTEYIHDVGDLGDFHSVSIVMQADCPEETAVVGGSWFSTMPLQTLPTHEEFLRAHNLLL